MKLSVEALPVAPNQPIGQSLGVARSPGDDTFRQMLQALVAIQGAQGNGPVTLPGSIAGWLAALMGNAHDVASALDPTGEASTAAQDELAVPLTEVLAALQPVVNQSMASLQAGQLNTELLSVPADMTDQPETEGQPELAVLALSSLLGQALQINGAQTPTEARPSVSAASAEPLAQVEPPGDVATPKPGTIPQPVALGNETRAAQVVSARRDEAAVSPAPVTTNPVSGHDTNLPADAKAAVFALPEEGISDEPILIQSRPAGSGRTVEQTEAKSEPDAPVTGTVTTPFNGVVPKVVVASRGAPADPAAGLPAIPALHQVARAVETITQRGEHEVRLQLQPPALGQLLVQLQVSDGDVSVRMLAETGQAQNLIRDHLSELKAALSAQGFQVDQLTVAVGAEMSAFDTGQHQAQLWDRPEPRVPQAAASIRGAGGEQPGGRLPESLHAVDYQV